MTGLLNKTQIWRRTDNFLHLSIIFLFIFILIAYFTENLKEGKVNTTLVEVLKGVFAKNERENRLTLKM